MVAFSCLPSPSPARLTTSNEVAAPERAHGTVAAVSGDTVIVMRRDHRRTKTPVGVRQEQYP
jgi:hypothetical protein